MEPKKTNNITVESLYYLAGALKFGVDGGFQAREHASAIWKNVLRQAGFEVPKKDKTIEEK